MIIIITFFVSTFSGQDHFCHLTLKIQNPTSKRNYPNELNTLGDHIRYKRLDLELFQKDIAGIIGVTEDTISIGKITDFNPIIG